jgi:HD superfamily phosphohydrolase YqeK
MELDEVAGQLKNAAASKLQDDAVADLLHDYLKCIRAAEAERVWDLAHAIRERVTTLALAISERVLSGIAPVHDRLA